MVSPCPRSNWSSHHLRLQFYRLLVAGGRDAALGGTLGVLGAGAGDDVAGDLDIVVLFAKG